MIDGMISGSVQATTMPASRVARYHTIVIGGGQAGLAVGHQLAERDIDFTILDAEARVGDTWRRRWDSLRLFTPAAYSGLPGMVFPAPPGHLPDKDEVADYLERYADRFELPVQSGVRVESLQWNAGQFTLAANGQSFEAERVVVCTGPLQRPRIPAVAARIDASIHQRHSSAYRSPFDLPEGPVLVVGAGPSGAQIALELSRFRKVWLAGRRTGNLPRRVLGRDLFDWLWPVFTRATADTRIGNRLRSSAAQGGDTLIGLSDRTIGEAGVTRVDRVTGENGGLPVCDGEVLQPRVIVWCTGFTADYGWMHVPSFSAAGQPRHYRGISQDVPGLYFAGLRFQHRLTSSLIGGVGADAAFIAAQIASNVESQIASLAEG